MAALAAVASEAEAGVSERTVRRLLEQEGFSDQVINERSLWSHTLRRGSLASRVVLWTP